MSYVRRFFILIYEKNKAVYKNHIYILICTVQALK